MTWADIVDRIEAATNRDRKTIGDALDIYIAQVEDLDHTTIDPENIDPDTADFLEGTLMSAYHDGLL